MRKDESFIDTPKKLSGLCQELQSAEWLALDTEFMRDKTYYPKLCLIQVATEDIVACIDPLCLTTLDLFYELIYNPQKTKVLHASRQDLEIFYHLHNAIPQSLFDTQIGAAFLGYNDQIGYGTLVERVLNVQLNKAHTRTNWQIRPLEQGQIHYAADDVRYLARLYPIIRDKLITQHRLDWLVDDFSVLSNIDTYVNPPELAWCKVAGRKRLKGQQLATLQHLTAWRERQAQKADKPRKWIINDNTLIRLAQQMPEDIEQLAKIQGIQPKAQERIGQKLLALIVEAKQFPKSHWPEPPQRIQPMPEQKAQICALMSALQLCAQQHNIRPTVLASHKDIEKLVMGKRDLPILKGWRARIAGQVLLDVLNGKLKLEVLNGMLKTP